MNPLRIAALSLAAGALLACGKNPGAGEAHGAAALPFIENDYQAALAQAKASARPLFVEVWAPW